MQHPGKADLIFQQFDLLLAHFLDITNTSAREQRTDSFFVAPNIKRAGRLSLTFDVLVQAVKSIPAGLRTERMNKVLDPGFRTDLLFRAKGAEVASRLQEMLDLIHELLKITDSHPDLKESNKVRVARRFLKSSLSTITGSGKHIAPNPLQSAYDQDATYRKKGNKRAVGYSDQEMLEDRLSGIKERTGVEDVYADGAYYGKDALKTVEKNSVRLHFTNMIGKGPHKIPVTGQALSRQLRPSQSRLQRGKEILTAHFSLADCKACSFNKMCWVKIGKKDSVLKDERKSLLAARRKRNCRLSGEISETDPRDYRI